ncbi:MAG: S24 family peptidase [Patescibacteria group bacterium]
MHLVQEKLLSLLNEKNISGLTLRDIGSLIGEKFPQKIKHHLSQLERKGFVSIDKKNKIIKRVNKESDVSGMFISIPIFGSANCGPATVFAEERAEGYLKVSKKIMQPNRKVFALHAEGNSMNKANVGGKTIEDGDFVIVDAEQKTPQSGEYVVSVIDGMANVKKFIVDKKNQHIVLQSESSQDYFPIFVHAEDNYQVSGKVVDVIKNIN